MNYQLSSRKICFSCKIEKFISLIILGLVSNAQAEIYPSLLQIQPLLLLTELEDFTQEATQAARWRSRQFREPCTGYRLPQIYMHRITDKLTQWPAPVRWWFCNSGANRHGIWVEWRKSIKHKVWKAAPESVKFHSLKLAMVYKLDLK